MARKSLFTPGIRAIETITPKRPENPLKLDTGAQPPSLEQLDTWLAITCGKMGCKYSVEGETRPLVQQYAVLPNVMVTTQAAEVDKDDLAASLRRHDEASSTLAKTVEIGTMQHLMGIRGAITCEKTVELAREANNLSGAFIVSNPFGMFDEWKIYPTRMRRRSANNHMD